MKTVLRRVLRRIHFGTILGVLVAVYISFYLAQTISYNYKLKQQIGDLRGQLSELENQKQVLQYKIQYYQTDDYKEKQARAKLGLQAPGESVIILPHKDASVKVTEDSKKPKPQKSNWQQWVDFLAGRST